MGFSWQVVPEAYSFLAPSVVDLYRERTDCTSLRQRVDEWRLRAPDEVWVLTTDDRASNDGLDKLAEWARGLNNCLDSPLVLRAWKTAEVADLTDAKTVQHFSELALRACLLAHDKAGPHGQVVLSLAGGRKTMSADVQRAGSVLGCDALLHVVVDERGGRVGAAPAGGWRRLNPDELLGPLGLELATIITPVVVGRANRSELLDLDLASRPAIAPASFPLTLGDQLASSQDALAFDMPDSLLDEAIADRETQGSNLFGNYLRQLSEHEPRDNWRSLYRLPPRVIEALRKEAVDDRHYNLLARLPKADLHSHLGGILDVVAQRNVGRVVWDSLDRAERSTALGNVCHLLKNYGRWPWDWNRQLREGNRGASTAAVLVHATDKQLQTNLFDVTEPRVGLSKTPPHYFDAYERAGELSGSALLGTAQAVKPYVQQAYAACRKQGLTYVEWRGSPQKYTREPLEFVRLLLNAVADCQAEDPGCDVRFIVIADRRDPGSWEGTVQLAVDARAKLGDFVVGVDVAGDEQMTTPDKIAPSFIPAFRACLSITIHAGENTAAENIWQAAYHLHADRIGHGLTLADHPRLATRFRDRDICLELCPSSNVEVVGFRDPRIDETEALPEYPLEQFLRMGIPLTICTDNAGTSRCTLAGEYVRASRMINGLSLWDALGILRQGFAHAFAPAQTRATLLRDADAKVYELICEHFEV